MGIADFQNPLANMPIMQQMQQSQNQQIQSAPMIHSRESQNETQEHLQKVIDADEQKEKDRINREDEDRESRARRRAFEKAKNDSSPKEDEKGEKNHVTDGIHGTRLDIQI